VMRVVSCVVCRVVSCRVCRAVVTDGVLMG
jgi:hypothetical protein